MLRCIIMYSILFSVCVCVCVCIYILGVCVFCVFESQTLDFVPSICCLHLLKCLQTHFKNSNFKCCLCTQFGKCMMCIAYLNAILLH